jgi:hypothetical protein
VKVRHQKPPLPFEEWGETKIKTNAMTGIPSAASRREQ